MNRVINRRSARRLSLKGRGDPRAGQAMLELSLMLPLVVMIIIATTDLGRMFYAYVTVTSAANRGAMYGTASVYHATDTTGIRLAALADTMTLFDTSASNPQVTSSTSTDAFGDQLLTVTVSYVFKPLFPYPGLPGTFTMTRAVQMRVNPI